MVTVYEIVCDKCKGMFHMFTIDRSTKPRDGLLCTTCEKKTRLEEKRVIRVLRKSIEEPEYREVSDLTVFCGFSEDTSIYEPRMVNR